MLYKNLILGFSSIINFTQSESNKLIILKNMAKDRIKQETIRINELTAIIKNEKERRLGSIIATTLMFSSWFFIYAMMNTINEWTLSLIGLVPLGVLFYSFEEAQKIEQFYLKYE